MTVDMTTYQMLDDVNLAVEASAVTASTRAVAGYVNGKYANWPALVAKYSKTSLFLLSIDVQGNPSIGAQCLDVESGDATIAQAAGWVKTTAAAGKAAKDYRYYPKLYVQESNLPALVAALSAAGIPRSAYLLWSAHYTGEAHICGPATCGCSIQADATQWTNSYNGASVDASLAYGYFFSGPGGEVPGTITAASTLVAPAALKPPESLRSYPSYQGVTLDWGAVAGAASYDVQLLAGEQVGRTEVTVPHVSLPVTANTDYMWRVACLPGGEWSAEESFTTPPKPVTETAPVTPPETAVAATSATTATPAPVPVVNVPEPSPVPANAPTGNTGVLVYVQETLAADIAAQLGLPTGTILFIPHTVEGA